MAARRAEPAAQGPLPVQSVTKPILCSPYAEPQAHWTYSKDQADWLHTPGRRPASYWYKTERTGSAQLSLLAEEERDDLPLVNLLRDDVRRWREANYEAATPVTKQLLAHWAKEDRPRRLFFCQREAVETVIYLTEILGSGRRPRWTPKLSRDDFELLCAGRAPSFAQHLASQATLPTLADAPEGGPALRRYGCKMATGSGKTVVMAMLVAWALCNRGRSPSDTRFPSAVLAVCPNLTIRERLQVLRPDVPTNYYEAFDLVPSTLLPELAKGRVLVTNWHRFAPESEHVEGGKSYAVVDKGPESPAAFCQRLLGDLAERGPIMVLNDEAHHAYRPKPLPPSERVTGEDRADREEATVWVDGLDRLNRGVGIAFCVDLSATPFYLTGSGYVVGSPLPWLVSDFGLVDAIESGIVKIPRLPVSDATGKPEPKYFRLWENIVATLQPGERLPGRKPKPEAVYREAQDALLTLASQWRQQFDVMQAATPGQERTPPVLIVVCDNTDIAKLFYEKISGERTVEVVADDSDDEDDNEDDEQGAPPPARRGKTKQRVEYGQGEVFPAFFANTPARRHTLRIDSKLLAEAESEDGANRQQAAQQLRQVLNTVGRPGQPGEQVRCVVAVQMLNEGWDANNVTHILGLRAFTSQLLCEQVVGRGLRRMDYTPDKATGLLSEEYVDVYGVPFSVIPFKGQPTGKPIAPEPPKNHVRALEERQALELRFPVVESYAFALRRNLIKADIAAMEPLTLQPERVPTAVFVQPRVGYTDAAPGLSGAFDAVVQDRQAYYDSVHLQTIKFDIARAVVSTLSEVTRDQRLKRLLLARHHLFPQVYRLVDAFVSRKVAWNGCPPQELGLQRYATAVVERLVAAIEPNDAEGEPPLLPVLNRYRPIGSTRVVDFLTTRPVHGTLKSHINQVVLDTGTWEQAAAFRLEQSQAVACYARADGTEFTIPYEFQGSQHAYEPDFLVRLANQVTVVLEIKGYEDDQDRAKYEAARRWVRAVNHWGQLGVWRFHVCKNPQVLGNELAWLLQSSTS